MKTKNLMIVLFLLTGLTTWSQVKFDALVSRKKLGINERLRVDFEMNKDGDNFKAPSFEGFTVVGGPNQSVSRQYLNGKSSFKKVYSYYLAPKKRGNITIAQAEIVIDGEVYKTIPITVEVTAAVDTPTDGVEPIFDVSDKLHLVAEVSNTNPFLNEAINVVYKLYVSKETAVNGWNEIDAPKFENFWSQNIDEKQFKVYDGQYNGESYRYVILRRSVLYPQKTGELVIEPLALSISVEVPTNRRNMFGGMMMRSEQVAVAAKNRTINVKPLPEAGKPDTFGGAVGNFDFNVITSRNSLDAQEALDLTVSVSGTGNLKLFTLPQPKLPSSLEVYEPQLESNVSTTMSGMRGSISNRYTVVPQSKGKYPIAPIEFSYFDPSTETYKTLSSQELIINVENGPLNAVTESTNDPITGVAEAGNQFKYIKSDANLQAIDKKSFFNSTVFWSLVATPFLLIPLFIIAGRKRQAYRSDIKGQRLRKADKMARKFLSDAKKSMGDQKPFYLALERSLHNYLKAKLNIQTSDMSKERIQNLLEERQVDNTTTSAFIELLKSCEFARYTPASSVTMQQDYDKASSVIAQIDKQL